MLLGLENDRFDKSKLPPFMSVSIVTIAELQLGVLNAKTLEVRARRLATLQLAQELKPIPIDRAAADAWARLAAALRESGKEATINDSWIAATAIARQMPIATQDADYDGMPGVRVIKI